MGGEHVRDILKGILMVTLDSRAQFSIPEGSQINITYPDNFKSYGLEDFPGGSAGKNPPCNAGVRVRALVQKDFTCHRATKSLHATMAACCNYQAHIPRTYAPQQKKPPQ